jgi:phage shock protein PspC (stress-responsive transcriptional regulator)
MVARPCLEHSGDMTTTPPHAPHTEHESVPPAGGPRVTREEVRDVSRLRRTILADRKLGGVCGGVARHFDIDPTLVRVIFVVLAFFGGAGLLLYVALWLLLPEDGAPQAIIPLDERSLTVALAGLVIVAAIAMIGDSWGVFWFPWPLAVIGLIVLLVVMSRTNRRTPPPPLPYQPGQAPPSPSYQPPSYQPSNLPAAGYPAASYPTTEPVPASGTATFGAAASGAATAVPQPPAPPRYGVPQSPVPPRPRDPRKRGPILFWFTLALVTLGMGVLGMADVYGADVPASAYPALATGLVGLMLLVGAFFGRAGGLILLGLVTTTVLAGVTVGENVNTETLTFTPTTAADLIGGYSQGAGEMVVDLRGVTDLSTLDGRTLTLETGAGRIEVIVPDGIDVVASGSAAAGDLQIFDTSRDGIGVDLTSRLDVPAEQATLTIDAQLGFGEIVIHTADAGQ